MSGHAKMPPASHQVSATSLKLLIQQIHPHVRVERDSGMCSAKFVPSLCVVGLKPVVARADSRACVLVNEVVQAEEFAEW